MNTKLLQSLFIVFLMSLSLYGFSQPCRTYLPSEPGNMTELTTYDKKGKVTGTIQYVVDESVEQADGTLYKLSMRLTDDKGEVTSESLVEAECKEGIYFVDTQTLVDPSMYSRYQSMNMTFDGSPLQFPQDLKEGLSLPDADLILTMESGISITVNILLTNRKVVAEESVTTPAGKFYCYVIEYDSEIKAGLSMTTSTRQWLSGDVGIVKQETYNKNGKLTGSMELTALRK